MERWSQGARDLAQVWEARVGQTTKGGCGQAMSELVQDITDSVNEGIKAVTTDKSGYVKPHQNVKRGNPEFTTIEKMIVLLQYILTRNSITRDLS
jgi:hypothetical protein